MLMASQHCVKRAQAVNSSYNVDGLCREFRARISKLREAEGGRLKERGKKIHGQRATSVRDHGGFARDSRGISGGFAMISGDLRPRGAIFFVFWGI